MATESLLMMYVDSRAFPRAAGLSCSKGMGHVLRSVILLATSWVIMPQAAWAQNTGALPECPARQPAGSWHECRGVIEDRASGTTYMGDFRRGQFDGMGLLRSPEGSYTGEFRLGRMDGQGVFTTSDNRRYVGEFRGGAMTGAGRLFDAQGREVFSGQFIEGQPQRNSGQPPVPQPGPAMPAREATAPWPLAQAPATPAPAPVQTVPQAPTARPAAVPQAALPAASPVAQAGAAPQGPAPPGATLPWPAIPRGARTPIEGAFYVQRTYMMMGGGISLNHVSYFFTANGRFSASPSGGVNLASLAAQPAASRYEGSYWIDGQELVMAWADGRKPWRSKYEGDAKSIVIGSSFASRQSPFPRGWRLDGSYEGGASIGGGTSSSSTIRFRRDGTFTRGSSVAIVSSTSRSEVTAGGSAAGGGTYEFDGFVLTLRENGNERKFTVFAYGERDADGRPEHIFNQGLMMKRQ